jgi:hypothetical protein
MNSTIANAGTFYQTEQINDFKATLKGKKTSFKISYSNIS